MKTESVIMVQIANREWTLEALHCACLLARNTDTSARIALVRMVPVQHAGWLGTTWGYMGFTRQEQAEFADYQATIEDYGLECVALPFQYVTLAEATAQAAAYVGAQIVFAQLPESAIPVWARFQRFILNRQLARRNRQWIQHPVYDRGALAVTVEAVLASSGLAELHNP